jgi:hypothetical protein
MANMTYCMFENTSNDLHQCVTAMREARDLEDLDLNEYEQDGFRDLFHLCQRYIEFYKMLTVNDFEEENE